MTDTWGVHLLGENGDLLHSGPATVEERDQIPEGTKKLFPDNLEFIIRTHPKTEIPGHTVFQVKVIKNNAYYSTVEFTSAGRIQNRGMFGGQYGSFGTMVYRNSSEPKKSLICPCGIHRTDCDYHK